MRRRAWRSAFGAMVAKEGVWDGRSGGEDDPISLRPLFAKTGDQYVGIQTTPNRRSFKVATLFTRRNSHPPPHPSMDTIQQRFLQAEEDFLLAAQSGVQPLSDFAERWQTLQSDWECCIHDADHSTQQLANGVAAKIRMFAGDLLTFESRALSLEDDLLNSIEDAFASLSLEDPIDPQTIPVPEYPPRVSGPSPPDSAEWLLLNLHNPYPLPHLRFSGGRTAGSKHMKDWFSKARQRIGWSRLLRDRFAGCRSLAIDAAFRAFIRDNPNNPLDFDTKTAFLAIKNHAELVYGNNHPSPERHRSISPTPSLTSSASEDTDHDQCATPPSTVYSNRPSKRVILEPSGAHSRKRRRLVDHYPCYHQTPLMGPRVQPLQSPPSQTRETPSPCAGTISLRHRKRRLSESDHDGSQPKRPRGVEGGRNHSVSDPLPRTEPTWIDFDRSFQIPNPASIDPLELSSFDINFFNPLSLPSCTVSSPSGELYTNSTRPSNADIKVPSTTH